MRLGALRFLLQLSADSSLNFVKGPWDAYCARDGSWDCDHPLQVSDPPAVEVLLPESRVKLELASDLQTAVAPMKDHCSCYQFWSLASATSWTVFDRVIWSALDRTISIGPCWSTCCSWCLCFRFGWCRRPLLRLRLHLTLSRRTGICCSNPFYWFNNKD